MDGLLGFPVEGALDKAERLDFGESLMTHAMVLEGVRLDDAGRPVLWKVENYLLSGMSGRSGYIRCQGISGGIGLRTASRIKITRYTKPSETTVYDI